MLCTLQESISQLETAPRHILVIYSYRVATCVRGLIWRSAASASWGASCLILFIFVRISLAILLVNLTAGHPICYLVYVTSAQLVYLSIFNNNYAVVYLRSTLYR